MPTNHMIVREIASEKKVPLKTNPRKKRTVYTFRYKWDDGSRVTGKALAYAKSLAVPPAVYDVRILAQENANGTLAYWNDSKGREVRLYSAEHNKQAALEKYKRVGKFDAAYPKLLKRIIKDMEADYYLPEYDEGHVEEACVLYLIAKTGFRLGSNNDTGAEVKAYGAATLLGKHVTTLGNKVTFDFIGKKGVRIHKSISDHRIAAMIRERKTSRWSAPIFDTTPEAVRNYCKSLDERFKVKDFRTRLANEIAEREVEKRQGPAPDERRFKRWQNEVGDKVAKKLGNTRAVCINSYINPQVWRSWEKEDWEPFVPKSMRGDDD